MGVIKVGVAALALSVSLPVANACACSCIYRTEAEHMESSDAVFEGVAVERQGSDSQEAWNGNEPIMWAFDVDLVLKGEVSDPQSIWTPRHSGMCGVDFEVGRSYRVYGSLEDGKMRTSSCSGTRALDSNEPPPPQESPGPVESPSPEPSLSVQIMEPIAPVPSLVPTSVPPIPSTPAGTPISLPAIEAITLGASREPQDAPWLPAVGLGSIAILTAGAALRGWRLSKQR